MREWTTSIVEDPKVQARLLADARTGKLHPSVMTMLMAYAYGRPRDTTTSEPMIPMSEIEDARQRLEIKLQRISESWDCVETGKCKRDVDIAIRFVRKIPPMYTIKRCDQIAI